MSFELINHILQTTYIKILHTFQRMSKSTLRDTDFHEINRHPSHLGIRNPFRSLPNLQLQTSNSNLQTICSVNAKAFTGSVYLSGIQMNIGI